MKRRTTISSSPDGSRGDYTPAPYQLATWTTIGAAVLGVLLLFSVRCSHGPTSSRVYVHRSLPPEPEPVLLASEPPDDEYYPCSDCHEDEPVNRKVRELEDEHDELDLRHGELWCLHCHAGEESDMLRLANGAMVGFDESWRLCTQCHGKKLADWRGGVHGKRTGYWHGPKEYRTCIECHSPHSPKFAPLKPEPPPDPENPHLVMERVALEEITHE